jgi:hypothetical protein
VPCFWPALSPKSNVPGDPFNASCSNQLQPLSLNLPWNAKIEALSSSTYLAWSPHSRPAGSMEATRRSLQNQCRCARAITNSVEVPVGSVQSASVLRAIYLYSFRYLVSMLCSVFSTKIRSSRNHHVARPIQQLGRPLCDQLFRTRLVRWCSSSATGSSPLSSLSIRKFRNVGRERIVRLFNDISQIQSELSARPLKGN